MAGEWLNCLKAFFLSWMNLAFPIAGKSFRWMRHLACSRRVVDLLQGMEHGDIPQADKRVFLEKLRHTSDLQQADHKHADIFFIHDFQLAPLATFFPWMKPAIWMCHVDTADPDPLGKAYMDQFLDAYNVCIFDTPLSIFKTLPPEKAHVMTPTIDPFSEKNRYLTPARGLRMLAECGIDTRRPLITQVSRFGNWKNPWQVIDVYRLVKQKIPSVQVALVGAMEAADDINAMEILEEVQAKAGADPDIYLLYDPAVIKHPEVNAFQRYSSVILQRSIREGFGLTVTEVMVERPAGCRDFGDWLTDADPRRSRRLYCG